jgi:hypothetical protein
LQCTGSNSDLYEQLLQASAGWDPPVKKKKPAKKAEPAKARKRGKKPSTDGNDDLTGGEERPRKKSKRGTA